MTLNKEEYQKFVLLKLFNVFEYSLHAYCPFLVFLTSDVKLGSGHMVYRRVSLIDL